MRLNRFGFALGIVLALTGSAYSAGFLTNGLAQATGPLTGNETFPADTNLTAGQNPASEAISVNALGASLVPTRSNLLIGGDAGTNLWQRATTGASQTTTVAYGGPDRWAYWSGTNTAITLSRDSTAASLAPGYQYDFKLARTNGQTGVVQVCMAQEIESAAAYQVAGRTVELDFTAYAGALFSASAAAGYPVTAYIVTGTGSNEGMQKLAWGINAGGGGSSGWTGQANATAAVIPLGARATHVRLAAVANIPATATEIGVAICWTPVGTAGATDSLFLDGIQLVRNDNLSGIASATVGYSCANVACTPFERRPIGVEQALQYRFFYRLNEPANTAAVVGMCQATGANTNICNINLPVPMQATTPTIAITTAGTFKVNIAGTPTTVASPTASVCSSFACAVTAANTNTAGQAELLSGGGGTGAWDVSAEF